MATGALRLFLGLLVTCGPAGASAVDTPEGKLTIVADRDRLLLGTDREATLRIEGPAELSDLEVAAQVGRVLDIRRVGPGQYSARYRPPPEPFPRVAILAASGRLNGEVLHGWMTLPLWGSGKAAIRSKRGSSVRVRIGEAEFGPVLADRTGKAFVPVVVPPGVRYGNDGHRKVDLHLPPWPRAYVVPERTAFRADLGDTVPLRIYAVTERGEPLSSRSLRVGSDRGRARPARRVEPGVYVTPIEVPPGPSGPIRIDVGPEESASLGSCSITARPGPPAKLTLHVPPGPFHPGQAKIPVHVSMVDALGNPTRGKLRIITNIGFVLGPKEAEPGRYTALANIPIHFGGKDRWRIEARVSGDQDVARATNSVPLRPDAPARVVVRMPGHTIGDGSTSVAVVAEVLDRHGNLVADASPEASASRGSLRAVGADKGRFSYRWTPPAHDDLGRGDIHVRLGTIEKTAGVRLDPSPRLISFAAKAGYLHGTGNLSTPALAVEAGVRIPVGRRPLWLLLESGWERGSATGVASADGIGGRRLAAKSDVIPFVASAGWRPRLRYRLVGSVTLGTGLLLVSSRVGLEGQPTVTDFQLAPVASGAAGLGYRYGPGYALVEGRYRWAATADRDSHRGPLSAAGVQIGYAVELF